MSSEKPATLSVTITESGLPEIAVTKERIPPPPGFGLVSASSASAAAAAAADVEKKDAKAQSSLTMSKALTVSKGFLREHLFKSGRAGRGSGPKGWNVAHLVVSGVLAIIPSAVTAAFDALVDWTFLSAIADFVSMASLFDAVRVDEIVTNWAAIGPGQDFPTSNGRIQVPVVSCYDPDARSASTFNNLIPRDFTSPMNKWWCTGSPHVEHRFKLPKAATLLNQASAGVVGSTLSDWNLPAAAMPVGGGLYVSIYRYAYTTGTIPIGLMSCSFRCTFAFRAQ